MHFDHTEEWSKKTELQKRMAAYDVYSIKEYTLFSDLEGKGYYIGTFRTRPRFYGLELKVVTYKVKSCTFKHGKFYGDKGLFKEYIADFEDFNWLKSGKGFPVMLLTDSTIKDILSKKYTSQEDLYKVIAHRHGITQWKLFKVFRFKADWLASVCKNPLELIERFDSPGSQLFILITIEELIKLALVTRTTLNATWSDKRFEREIQRMREAIAFDELESKEQIPVYENVTPLPEGFHLINTERDAYLVKTQYSNCVYDCYWPKICKGKYLVFTTPEKLCIGYQILADRDILFDQISGVRNSYVEQATRDRIDALLRPFAQEIAKSFIQKKDYENVINEYILW